MLPLWVFRHRDVAANLASFPGIPYLHPLNAQHMDIAAYASFRALMQTPTTQADIANPTSVFSNPLVPALMNELRPHLGEATEQMALAPYVEMIRSTADPLRACQAALLSGTITEVGARPEQFLPSLVALLERIGMPAARQLVQPSQLDADLDARRAAAGVGFLLLAIMTQASRSMQLRVVARRHKPFMEVLEALQLADQAGKLQALWFVDKLFKSYDGEMMIVVPEKMRGLHVRLEAVQNNFHLFSLIQTMLPKHVRDLSLPGQGEADKHLHAFIMGEPYNWEAMPKNDAAKYSFGDHAMWSAAKAGRAGMDGFLAGDAGCWDIPLVDGIPVLVLGLKTTFGARSWDVAMFPPLHDALRTGWEVVKVMEEAEMRALEARILALGK
jgi:hypothetical protein